MPTVWDDAPPEGCESHGWQTAMAFFRSVSFSEPLPTIEGDTVYLRAPQMSDYGEWATLREASRAFLTPWEPTWPGSRPKRAIIEMLAQKRIRRIQQN